MPIEPTTQPSSITEQTNNAYHRCIAMLARREHSQLELRQQLQQQNIQPHIIDETLECLVAENYQSDQRFAEMFIRSRISRHYGPKKICYELQQKGIDHTIVSQAIADYVEDFVEHAKYLIYQRTPRNNLSLIFNGKKQKDKITRFLFNKGYDYDTIALAFEILQGEDK